MDKKGFAKIMAEAKKEYEEEKYDRVKDFLKERMREYEIAKATAERLEKQFKKLELEGFKNAPLLLGVVPNEKDEDE